MTKLLEKHQGTKLQLLFSRGRLVVRKISWNQCCLTWSHAPRSNPVYYYEVIKASYVPLITTNVNLQDWIYTNFLLPIFSKKISTSYTRKTWTHELVDLSTYLRNKVPPITGLLRIKTKIRRQYILSNGGDIRLWFLLPPVQYQRSANGCVSWCTLMHIKLISIKIQDWGFVYVWMCVCMHFFMTWVFEASRYARLIQWVRVVLPFHMHWVNTNPITLGLTTNNFVVYI